MHQFSICIIRLSSLGDIILTTPLIRAIRKAFPDACIDMIIADHFAEAVQNNPHIDNVLTINTKSGMIDFFQQMLSLRKEKEENVLRHLTLELSEKLREHRKERALISGTTIPDVPIIDEPLVASVTPNIDSSDILAE